MSPKQERFVQEYLIDLNATQAAIRAGYSVKSAGTVGGNLSRSAEIRAAVLAAMKKREEVTGVTAEWVLRRLQYEAEFEGEGASHAARVSALRLAMKHLGMLMPFPPRTDPDPFDLSGLTDGELDHVIATVGPLLGLKALPRHVPAVVPGDGAGAVEQPLPQ